MAKKKRKRIQARVALFLVLAVVMQYTFMPEMWVVYGTDNVTASTQSVEEKEEESRAAKAAEAKEAEAKAAAEKKAAEEKAAAEKKAAEEKAAAEKKAAEEKAAAEKAAAEKAAAEKKAAEEKAAAEKAAAEKEAAEKAAAEKEAAEKAAEQEAAEKADAKEKAEAAEKEAAPAEDADDAQEEQGEAAEEPAAEAEEAAAPAEESEAQASEEEVIAEEEEEEAEEEEAEEEIKYPAAKFSGSAGGVHVTISAPEGALPEGTKASIHSVSPRSIESSVQRLYDGAEVVKAVDITFRDKDGKEIEPKKNVSVTFSSSAFSDLDEGVVVHIKDNGRAEGVGGSRVSPGAAKATFRADDFSIYAVVETGDDARLLVKFMNGSKEIASMYVKKGDNLEQVLYDPGTGTTDGDTAFKGWTADADYTVANNKVVTAEGKPVLSIGGVRSAVASELEKNFNDGDTITYYAALLKSYSVTYLDERGVIIKTDDAAYRADSSTDVSYKISMSYTPLVPEEWNFEGWARVKGGSMDTSTIYQTDQQIVLNDLAGSNGKLTLRAYITSGNWISFKQNGGSYTGPEFVKTGENTKGTAINGNEEKADPTRYGYTFTGWYEDEECTQPFTFGSTINKNLTLYAGWQPNETAGYTVIIWKQSIDGTNYEFEEAVELTGNVGETISAQGRVSRTGSGNNAYATVNGSRKQYTGFHLDTGKYDTSVATTIAPEGNSVANIYYDRNVYKLTFQIPQSGYWRTIKTIQGRYQENISANFPIVGDNGITYNNGERWSPQANNVGLNEVIVYLDIMPAGDVTFHLSTSTATTKTMNYWVEAIEGDTESYTQYREYKGVRYGLYNSINANYNGITVEDYIELAGFTKKEANPSYTHNNGNFTYYVNRQGSSTAATTVDFYYTRDGYPITYMDGAYVTGSNVELKNNSTKLLKASEDIGFGEDISDYGYNRYENIAGSKAYVPEDKDGFVFAGWFIDSKGNTAYDFDTMPQGGVIVYAKWVQAQYRGFLHPNADGDDSLTYGDEHQSTSFLLNYGDQISSGQSIYAERDDYELIGWYRDEACTSVFNFASFVANDSTVTGAYDKSRSTETDQWGHAATSENKDKDRFWVNNSIDLYAKWRSKLDGALGINVVYVTDEEGCTVPEDDKFYTDNSSATAGSAASAPEGKLFDHWEVQKWSGSAFVKDKDVLPGESFAVHSTNAKVEDITDGTQTEEVNKKYTIQVKAVYKDVEEETPTHISWFRNDGTKAFHIDKEDGSLKINEAVAIQGAPSKTGYAFLGWSKVDTADTLEAAEAWESNSSNWTQNLNTPNLVYYNDGKFYRDAGFSKAAKSVAADESTPYQAIFAVWCPIHYTVKFDSNIEGATGTMQDQAFQYNEQKALTANAFQKAQHEFLGWNTKEDGSGTSYADQASVKNLTSTDGGVVTLYAQWRELKAEDYITLNPTDVEKTYDGNTYTAGVATATDSNGHSVKIEYQKADGSWTEDPTEIKATDVADSIQAINVRASVASSYAGYVTGTQKLVIKQREVTVTGDGWNSDQPYTGEEYKKESYTFDGIVSGETATITYSIKGTNVGSYIGEFGDDFQVRKGDVETTANYKLTRKTPGSLKIVKSEIANYVTLTPADVEEIYDGTTYTAGTATASDKNGNTVKIEYQKADGSWTEDPSEITATNVVDSIQAINVRASVEDHYEGFVTGTQKLVIKQREVTVTGDGWNSDQPYTGKEYKKETCTFENIVEGEEATITYSIKGTEVGTYTGEFGNDFQVKKGETNTTANYKLTEKNPGSLNIIKSEIAKYVTLNPTDVEKTYDGNTYTAGIATATDSNGHAVKVEYQKADGSWTEDPSEIKAANVADSIEKINVRASVEESYEGYVTGTQKLVIKQREVTVTGDGWNSDQPYTGKEYKKETYTFENIVEGEEATITYSIKGTNVGSYIGEFGDDFQVRKGDVETTANYKLTRKTPGSLKIVKSEIANYVTLNPTDVEKIYDGTAYTAGTATASDKNGNAVKIEYQKADGSWTEDPSEITATNVADSIQAINVRASVEEAYEGYVTGTQKLVIKQREVTVTGDGWNSDQPYTGEEYKKETYTFENIVEGQTATITYSIAGTEVGTYTGEFGNDFRVVIKKLLLDEDVTANYKLTEKTPGNLNIVKSEIAKYVTLTPADVEKTYDGNTYTAGTAKAVDQNGKTVKVEYQKADGTWTENPAEITATNVADSIEKINVRASVESSYEGYVTGTQKLIIKQREVTVTGDGWNTDQPYTGKEYQKETYTFENIVEGQKATVTYSIKGTEVGTYTGEFGNDFRVVIEKTLLDEDVTANYKLTEKTPGSLTIVKSEIANYVTLTPADVEKTYDGNTYTAGTAKAVDKNGKTVKVEYQKADGTWTENPAEITATYVADSIEKINVRASVESSYEGYVTGTQKLIIKQREVTVTGDGWNTDQPYTGEEYKKVTYTFENVVSGEEAVITYQIAGTEVGNYTGEFGNDFQVKKGEADTTANYKLTEKTPGSLTIVKSPIENFVTLNPTDVVKTYDGKTYQAGKAAATDKNGHALKVEYQKADGSWTEDPSEITAKNVADSVATIKVRVSEETSYEGYVTGTQKLVITKRSITLKSASATKTYDGKALTAHKVTVTKGSFAAGEKPNYTFSGSQKKVGSSKNTFMVGRSQSAAMAAAAAVGFDPNNYVITKVYGTLTVKKAPIPPANNDDEDDDDDDDNPGGGNRNGGRPAGGGGGPVAAPAAPVQVAAAPAPQAAPQAAPQPEAETVPEAETPTTIDDGDVPMTVEAYWALLNLICMILTALLSLIMLIRYIGKRREQKEEEQNAGAAKDAGAASDESEDETEIKKKGWLRLGSLIPAIVSIIAFILTEDITLPWQWIDKWTLLMVVILVVQIVIAILARKKKKDGDDEGPETAEAMA